MQQVRPQTQDANHGSRTLTVNETSADDATPSGSTPSASASATTSAGVLRLRGRAINSAKVQWEDDVVDNEFLGRKKSKICCIYHKPKAFDESSDDESDSSCGSNDSRNGQARSSRPHSHPHHHAHDHGHDHGPSNSTGGAGGGQRSAGEGGSSTEVQRPPTPPEPNAYDRQPKADKGKGKA
ncbi:hypothetical protein RQP46_000719 [Phenoliferia psychrophenolica]